PLGWLGSGASTTLTWAAGGAAAWAGAIASWATPKLAAIAPVSTAATIIRLPLRTIRTPSWVHERERRVRYPRSAGSSQGAAEGGASVSRIAHRRRAQGQRDGGTRSTVDGAV